MATGAQAGAGSGTRPAGRRLAAILGVTAFAVLAVAVFGRRHEFADLTAHHGALTWWLGGGDLYQFAPPDDGPRFTHSPFGALLMAPLTVVPPVVAGWLNLAASVTALVLVLAALLGRFAARHGVSRWYLVALAIPLALATEPVREAVGLGQPTLLLLGLVMADLVGLRRRAARDAQERARYTRERARFARESARGAAFPGAASQGAVGPAARTGAGPLAGTGRPGLRARWHTFRTGGGWVGAGIGLATALTVTPAVFIGYLALTGQWRAARTAVGTALAATAVSFAVAREESVRFFGGVLWHTDRVAAADLTVNQSLAGVLARLYDAPDMPALLWLTFSLIVLVVGLTRARGAHADGDEVTAFTLVGLTMSVISPNAWTYQLVFVLPAVLVLADGAARRREAGRPPVRRPRPVVPAGSGGGRQPPGTAGLWHAATAAGVYLLFVVAPIWAFRHESPATSHYADGLAGVLLENSLALALIVLVAALPWRPGAEPVLPPPPWVRPVRRPKHPAGAVR